MKYPRVTNGKSNFAGFVCFRFTLFLLRRQAENPSESGGLGSIATTFAAMPPPIYKPLSVAAARTKSKLRSLDCPAGEPSLFEVSRRPGLALTLCSVLIFSAGSAAARPFFPKVSGSYPGRNAAERVEAASVIIVDAASGRVVAAKNADQLRQAASLQKLVTALVIAEAGNLDKPVTVTAGDANCPRTRLPESVGGTYTRRELLQAMLVVSANDAARALARDNSGSESAFGAKMTAMARRLGATNSVFKDSAGFTVAGQRTTAADMVRILKAAYDNPLIRQANATKFLFWRKTDGRTQLLRNPLGILHRHPNCRGGKVGYTSAASDCVALVWEEDDTRLYGVALGGKTNAFWEQLAAAHKLLAYQVP